MRIGKAGWDWHRCSRCWAAHKVRSVFPWWRHLATDSPTKLVCNRRWFRWSNEVPTAPLEQWTGTPTSPPTGKEYRNMKPTLSSLLAPNVVGYDNRCCQGWRQSWHYSDVIMSAIASCNRNAHVCAFLSQMVPCGLWDMGLRCGRYSVRFRIGMLITARRRETLQGKKGGSKRYILPDFDEK